ncbi:hypothetical protein EFT81_24040 [Vibrio parahaemolyticus]|nr:hypothetical protein [Vibrio parahaemolyticus]
MKLVLRFKKTSEFHYCLKSMQKS